ncbi:MAG TPA: MBL fold metallo-hydrolase [Lachnospiraceae bacterium]|nr:MBL fold metallo-hydrolase [Lachnospiraceae bacterium]
MNREYFSEIRLTDDQIALYYLGQEGFLIRYRSTSVLIDPYLSYYVDQNCCTEQVKWVRRYEAPVLPDQLDFVDYVFCTHDHFDHADPDTLRAIAGHNMKVKFIVPEPARDTIQSYGIDSKRMIGAVAGQELCLGECRICPVPAAHEILHRDKNGNYKELGYKMFFGSTALFHAGDCCVYDGLAGCLENIDILMVPVNGRSYYKLHQDIVGNMNAEEAVLLARKTHARLLIPMHFDLYDVNGVNPAYFVDCLYRINPKQAFHMFSPGERYVFQAE